MTVFTLIATFTVDRIGRKPLLVAGALIMAVAMIVLGFLFDRHLVAATVGQGGGRRDPPTSPGGRRRLHTGVLVLVGTGGVRDVVGNFPNSIRGKAMSIAVAAQWIMNFIVSSTFPVMDGSTTLNAHFNHGFAYWVYGVCAVLAAIFVIRFVPETKGRPLESIQELWHGQAG